MAVDLTIVARLVREPLWRPADEIGVEDLPSDWRVWFEERAAIMEYDGGLSRETAEAKALSETFRLMQEGRRRQLPNVGRPSAAATGVVETRAPARESATLREDTESPAANSPETGRAADADGHVAGNLRATRKGGDA